MTDNPCATLWYISPASIHKHAEIACLQGLSSVICSLRVGPQLMFKGENRP
jgi:hypothetical protein